jgi:hypothetical protein
MIDNSHLFTFAEEMPGLGRLHTTRITLPAPARIKNPALRDAIVELESLQSDRELRESRILKLQKTIDSTKARSIVEMEKEIDGKTNDLEDVEEQHEKATAALKKGLKLRRKVTERVMESAGNVILVWRRERAAWTKDLERESRDHAVKLVTLATELSRLSKDFDTTLGVLAGYTDYDTHPERSALLHPHAITFDLVEAQAALDKAIAKLSEMKLA